MANIISIGTAVPQHRHRQSDILHFMQRAYKLDETDSRKLAFLYRHSEIVDRYSVLPDFSLSQNEWAFISPDAKNRSLDCRMKLFDQYAPGLSVESIHNCIDGFIEPKQITHLITVSCTGMSAPGLDLQIAELLQLPADVFRTSVNFMGCYAAIHALKIAKMICDSEPKANVVVVCTELCTLHFQQNYSLDNAASSLLFSDGSAAVLVSNNLVSQNALRLKSFYSEIATKGKEDMSWQLSTEGFLMKLSSYIPQLIEEDIAGLVDRALQKGNNTIDEISHWCIHPGGKKIVDVIQSKLGLTPDALSTSRKVLAEYGNMSSPTILFVLKEIMKPLANTKANVFGVAFGPGLTMETFIAEKA